MVFVALAAVVVSTAAVGFAVATTVRCRRHLRLVGAHLADLGARLADVQDASARHAAGLMRTSSLLLDALAQAEAEVAVLRSALRERDELLEERRWR